MSPITRRRIIQFRANRRGFWSLWIFLGIFLISLFAEGVANDKPLLVIFEDRLYFPVFETVLESEYGGEFVTEAEYRDDYVRELIENKGVEVSISTRNLVGDFKWNTNLNISSNKNMVKDLPDELLTNGYIQNGQYHIFELSQISRPVVIPECMNSFIGKAENIFFKVCIRLIQKLVRK